MLIIRDTRESGEMLEAALAAGVSAAGGDALLGGVLPTPAAPLLLARYGFDLAAVISASHNPYRDNGIKFFAGDGFKLSDEAELEIERELEARRSAADARAGGGGAGEIGRVARAETAPREDYLRELHARFCGARPERARRAARLRQRRHLPRRARRSSGGSARSVTVIADDARRAQHQRRLRLDARRARWRERVRAGGHDVGFAFDGDGDRVLAVDRRGAVVDGDELMALAALHLHARGRLSGNGVVVTVMTNYGFHSAMAAGRHRGRDHEVGDRYVLEELRARGWALGGEQSGHIIEMGFNRTGDGIASALLTLEALGGRRPARPRRDGRSCRSAW